MNTAVTVVVCLFFVGLGALIAISARRLVSWLYAATMRFWSKTVDPERRKYTDERFQQSWFWRVWWLSSVWIYRIVGTLIAIFFAGLLILAVTK